MSTISVEDFPLILLFGALTLRSSALSIMVLLFATVCQKLVLW